MLDEVRGVTAVQCARLGIEVVDVETERMVQASEVEASVSFNDRLCLVAASSRELCDEIADVLGDGRH